VSDAPATAAGGAASTGPRRGFTPRRAGRWLLAVLALLAVGAVAVFAVANPFARASGPPSDTAGNGTATSTTTMVVRRQLSSQMQVDGTLGYAGSSTVVLPGGTSPADEEKARQAVSAAQVALDAAEATLATDQQALEASRAVLAADRRKLAVDCAGQGAAGAGSGNGTGSDASSGSSACATTAQSVTTDEQTVTSGEQKVTGDEGSVATSRTNLSSANASLATTASSTAAYDQGSVFTALPSAGAVIRRGDQLCAIGGRPVLLLYGSMPAWRAFRSGMSPGADVAALHANLRALGYGADLRGGDFGSATASAIRALQADHGLPQTGALPLGSVIFKTGAIRVKSVIPKLGGAVQAGPVIAVGSTRHRVEVALSVSHQSEVKAGNRVTITLPDTSTTTGRVSSVGRVAAAGDQGSSPTIAVTVELDHQAAAGTLDEAPVQVAITTATVDGVLVVPVNALLALAGGGYGLEVVDPSGAHRFVAVELGLFDDADGLVQVDGPDVHAGQRIVVPAA
jgi:peptidoglycan hydrolase-like protein with peptidoglycan-binding domain